MEAVKKDSFLSRWMLEIATGFGMLFAKIGANSGCCFFLHQPEKPDLKRLRKF